MENIKRNNKYLYLIFKINNFSFFLFLISIYIKIIISEYFDSFEIHSLNETASLIDITDYYNLYPIITTNKKIYTGIPPEEKSTTNSKIIDISAEVTYNDKYILMACTENYLLSKINIETGEETSLLLYDEININIPNCICTVSLRYPFVFIGFSHIITPINKLENNTSGNMTGEYNDNFTELINFSDIEDNYNIINDSNNIYLDSYLEYTVTKVKLKTIEEDIGPFIDESFTILKYILEYKDNNLDKISFPRPFSCEVIDIDNNDNSRLVCGYVRYKKPEDELDNSYFSYIILMNSDFNKTEIEISVKSFDEKTYIRLQRLDSNRLIYLDSSSSNILTLTKEGSEYKIDIRNNNGFSSYKGLFFYNNEYVFTASESFMYIKKLEKKNYIQAIDNQNIQNIVGYYKEDIDKLLFIYENSSNEIKYFTIENMIPLYSFQAESKIIEVISNTRTEYNVSELIISPIEHKLLSFSSLIYYKSTTNHITIYDKYNFDKDTQVLTVEPSLNDWITFNFYYNGQTSEILTGFFVHDAKITIEHVYSNVDTVIQIFLNVIMELVN